VKKLRARLIFGACLLFIAAPACGDDVFSGAATDAGNDAAQSPTDAGPDAQPDVVSGGCAVDCQGGACVAGVCQPVVLGSGLNGPYGVAIQGTSIMVTEFVAHGRVLRFAVTGAGQTPKIIATEPMLATVVNDPPYVSQPFSVTANATDIYWSDVGGGASGYTKMFYVPVGSNPNIDGGGVVPFYALCAQGEVAANDLEVFWANQLTTGCGISPGQNGLFRGSVLSGHDGSIYFADGLDGGPRITPSAVALDATHTFVGAGNQLFIYDSSLVNDPTSVTDNGALLGGTAVLPAPPYAIASDFANVVWTDFAASGTVYSLPKNATLGTAPTVIASAQNGPLGIAIDDPGNYVYFTTYGDGKLMRMRKDGSSLTPILTGLDHPAFLVSDTTTLYFTNFGSGHGDGTLMRIAKPAP
jgi:hypothetical protein